MKPQVILGKSPIYSFEADPFIVKKDGHFHLYNHDVFGIKEHISLDGINFKFVRYLVLNAIRPFIDKNILYYEKMTHLLKFPFFHSHIRSLNLDTLEDRVVTNEHANASCPSIIDRTLFYSVDFKKMDHGYCEPTGLKILNGPPIIGLDNISSIRKFGSLFLGTLIDVKNGISHAKIVYCHPIKFPNVWRIGADFLTSKELPSVVTHVYVPAIIENKLYFNVRYGRTLFSSEKILMQSI